MKKIIDWIKRLLGSDKSSDDSSSSGFTLIELLIVIAVLAVLAAAVLIAIDPIEQLARGRDAGTKSSVGQIGRGMQVYYTARNGEFPLVNNVWLTSLKNGGEIKTIPNGFATAGCPGLESNFCFKVGGGALTEDFVIYTHLESKVERNRGTCADIAANTWYVYSSIDGKAGTYCDATAPIVKAYGSLLL